MSAAAKVTRSDTTRARAEADLDATIAAHKAADSAQNIPEGNNYPPDQPFDPAPPYVASVAPGGRSVDNAAIMFLPLGSIDPSSFNPRRTFDADAIAELAASITTHGMLSPIVVRLRHGEHSSRYEIVAGERRYRAALQARLGGVPARIVQLDDKQALQLAIVENLQRVDLDPIDEARGFAALRDQAGMTQAQIGAAVKRSQPVIAKSLALLKLPDDVLTHIQQGHLSASHGQVLAKFGDFPKVASFIAKWVLSAHTTTRQLEENPLGNSYDAERAGIIRHFSYETAFDKTVCDSCPFGAYYARPGGNDYYRYCLKPEHFDELQAAAVKERQRETNRAVQAAKRDGGSVLKLANMGHMNYTTREGTSVPAACTDACPCAAQALDGMGNLRPVCTDRKRYEALKVTQLKDEKKAKRETVKAQIEDLTTHLQQLDAVGAAQLAALILPQLRHVSKAAWEGAVAKHKAGHLTNKDAITAAALAQLDPVDLIRFSLQAIIGHELLASIEESWRPMDAWKYYQTVIPPTVKA